MFKSFTRGLLVLTLAGISTVATAQDKSSKSSRSGKSTAAKSRSSDSDDSRVSVSKASRSESASRAAPKGRLPRYFASLVDKDQRAEIYEIRASFRKKLETLQKELAELKESEMASIEEVLTATQRKKLAEMRESAANPTKLTKSDSTSTKSSSRRKSSSSKASMKD